MQSQGDRAGRVARQGGNRLQGSQHPLFNRRGVILGLDLLQSAGDSRLCVWRLLKGIPMVVATESPQRTLVPGTGLHEQPGIDGGSRGRQPAAEP